MVRVPAPRCSDLVAVAPPQRPGPQIAVGRGGGCSRPHPSVKMAVAGTRRCGVAAWGPRPAAAAGSPARRQAPDRSRGGAASRPAHRSAALASSGTPSAWPNARSLAPPFLHKLRLCRPQAKFIRAAAAVDFSRLFAVGLFLDLDLSDDCRRVDLLLAGSIRVCKYVQRYKLRLHYNTKTSGWQ